jgi:N-acetylmuramoyl-L-alanine amidase
MIYLDGELVNLTPFNYDSKIDPWEMTWGAKGVNARSRHIVYVGGLRYVYVADDDGERVKTPVRGDTRTTGQKHSMEIYVKYMILRHPDIKVAGHYHFSKKPCPSFDVEMWCKSIGLNERNIYRDGKD